MKALRKMLLIATATAFVATAGPAWAQDWAGSGRVKGVVTDTDGKLVLTEPNGRVQEFTPGNAVVVPLGYTGTWEQQGDYRELAIIAAGAMD